MGVDGKGRRLVTRLNIDDLTEHTGLTLAAIAKRTGRHKGQLRKYRALPTGLGRQLAAELCDALDVNPIDVWGAEVWSGLTPRRPHRKDEPRPMPDRQRWEDLAACRGRTDLDFFPPKGATKRDVDPVIQTCARCDVRMECAMFALVHNIEHGIWGGTSGNQRRRLRVEMDAGRPIVLPDIPPPIPPLAEPITRAVCGTRSGAYLHRRNKERHCDACAAAEDRRRAS